MSNTIIQSTNTPGLVQRMKTLVHPQPLYTEPFDVVDGRPVPTEHPAPVVPTSDQQRKAFGNVGATLGQKLGALAGAGGGAWLLAAGGAALLGPAGIALAIVGLPLGFMAGRIGGAIAGGAAGEGAATALNAAGVHVKMPSWLLDKTSRFSLQEVPRLASKFFHYGQPRLGPEDTAHIEKILQPGDIVVTARDVPYGTVFKTALKFLGNDSGTWTHAGVYGVLPGKDGEPGKPVVYEMHGSAVRPNTLASVVERQMRVMVLRPNYEAGHGQAVVDAMHTETPEEREKRNQPAMTYDYSFSLGNPDKAYCLGLVHDKMAEASPEIAVPTVRMLGKDIVTPQSFIDSPDMQPIYSTGGHWSDTFLGEMQPKLNQPPVPPEQP